MGISQSGKWHGRKYYFGLHYDLHARKQDTELGTRCSQRELVPMLKMMAPDFVQTDCKGHAGYTSWFSRVKHASVPPKLKNDALKQWRAATKKLGMPLHCHYSGIWDTAVATGHPDWCVKTPDGKPLKTSFRQGEKLTYEKMCPRGPYLDRLMIPQMRELIERYKVDGFWVDGDMWSVAPCYCKQCRIAFTEQTGIRKPPETEDDPNWPVWMQFTRDSFDEYVNRYCDAVHACGKGTLVCSNWIQTFRDPGEPTARTDWISGDNACVWGLDNSRCEARFLSTRGKPWDIMLWAFYYSHGHNRPDSPSTMKPPQMLMQEAAVLLAFGGNIQIYEHPPVRDGRLIPWRQKRLREVVRFIKKRKTLCQNADTIPQVALLHSEHHLRRTFRGRNLLWGGDVAPVQGMLYALLENSYGVDVLDEWALMSRLNEFPVVVAPERDRMSAEMIEALKSYVEEGGRLLVTGARSVDAFGPSFLGLKKGRTEKEKAFMIPAADGAVLLFSKEWRLCMPAKGKMIAPLYAGAMLPDKKLPYAAAVINRSGKGRVACIPADIGRDFEYNRYPLERTFIGDVMRRLAGRLNIVVKAPVCIDVALRLKKDRRIIHLINRASGIPNTPKNGAVDEIPLVGPVTITMKTSRPPQRVSLALEDGNVDWKYAKGLLTITVKSVRIHAAVIVA